MTDTVTPTDDTVVDTDTPEETTPIAAEDDAETFPRDYVERLRHEAAEARVKAKDRDDLAHRLHAALTAGTGRLADPTDLPFDEHHLAGDDSLEAAIDDLLARKPHLAARTPRGDIGQGPTLSNGSGIDLAGLLRSRA